MAFRSPEWLLIQTGSSATTEMFVYVDTAPAACKRALGLRNVGISGLFIVQAVVCSRHDEQLATIEPNEQPGELSGS